MRFNKHSGFQVLTTTVMALVLAVSAPLAAFAQTRVEVPRNKYSPRDDARLGAEAAQQARQQLPILNDRYIQSYVENIGRRLEDAIPREFQHPEFRYSFQVVNARDINAFALPGGYTFVNRGLIEAARTEGELAGVMAHEISHVALRHATAQATETQKYQIGSVLGQIAGAVIGGGLGQVIGAGSQIGFGAGALRYSRKYETQSDILGAQIMARAGYDPRDLANMFRTIERTSGGSGGPEFLSSHPNPGNRYQRINQEAALLRVNTPTQNTGEFQDVKVRLQRLGRAPSMQEISRGGYGGGNAPSGGGNNYPAGSNSPTGAGRVEYPSGRYTTFNGNYFRVSVPDNFQQGGGGDSVVFVPRGGAFEAQGQTQFTHGIMMGVERPSSNYLNQATDAYIAQLVQGNPYLRQTRAYQRGTLDGRVALATTLAGRSPYTGQTESVNVYTVILRNGGLFYMLMISPQSDYRSFQPVFENMRRSLQLAD